MLDVMLYVVLSVSLFVLLASMWSPVGTLFFPRSNPVMRLAMEGQEKWLAQQDKLMEMLSKHMDAVDGLQRQIDDLKRELEEMKKQSEPQSYDCGSVKCNLN